MFLTKSDSSKVGCSTCHCSHLMPVITVMPSMLHAIRITGWGWRGGADSILADGSAEIVDGCRRPGWL